MSIVARLIAARRGPFARVVVELLAVYGIEVPRSVVIGTNFQVMHRGFGIVLHPRTTIGDEVTLYHGVTIGRGDVWRPEPESALEGFHVQDGVIIGAGAKILCSRGTLTIGRGAVIGANAVVTQNVPAGEIWAGAPARRVGVR
jgi:serine O-acetyltransferase